MKTKKIRIKQGFTIVELVIVIGVIGVLAAVLIPTFINLNSKANRASDESLIKNLNTALAMKEQDPKDTKNATMQDAVDDLKEYGYLLPNLVTKSEDKLLWNQKTNRFILESDPKGEQKPVEFWRIQDSIKGDEIYSVYAGLNFQGVGENKDTVNVTVGFDAGESTGINFVNYIRPEGPEQKTVIRTNSELTALTIDAPKDTIKHYGTAGLIDIKSIAGSSYHEHGSVALAKIANGRIVVTEDAEIGGIHAVATGTSEEAYFNEIAIGVVGETEMPNLTRDPVAIDEVATDGNYTQYVLEVQSLQEDEDTAPNREYVWINVSVSSGTSTASTVVSSADGSKTTSYAAATTPASESTSTVAAAIAESAEKAMTAEEAEDALVPVSISSFADFKDFIENSTKVNAIITADFDITGSINFDRKIVINLNGHLLSNQTTGSRPFNLLRHADVTINGTVDGSGICMPNANVSSYGLFFLKEDSFSAGKTDTEGYIGPSLVLNGGKYNGATDKGMLIKVKNTYVSNVEMYGVTCETAGGGIIAFEGTVPAQFTDDKTGVYYQSSYNNCQIEDCVFVQGSANVGAVNPNLSIGAVMLNNGTIKNTKITSLYGEALAGYAGILHVEDCNVTVQNNNTEEAYQGAALQACYDATIYVNGGTYVGAQYGANVLTSSGRFIIDNASISGSVAALQVMSITTSSYHFTVADGYQGASITVNSGNINGAFDKRAGTEIIVKGGTFTADPTAYVDADIYQVTGDGPYTVTTK